MNVKSEQLLDEFEVWYPQVFKELTYPIVENRVPFTIPLVDSTIPPPKCKLYPLSELELEELRSQLKILLESNHIVPSSSPYGAPILFAHKKGGEGLCMCTNYHSLNSNTITN